MKNRPFDPRLIQKLARYDTTGILPTHDPLKVRIGAEAASSGKYLWTDRTGAPGATIDSWFGDAINRAANKGFTTGDDASLDAFRGLYFANLYLIARLRGNEARIRDLGDGGQAIALYTGVDPAKGISPEKLHAADVLEGYLYEIGLRAEVVNGKKQVTLASAPAIYTYEGDPRVFTTPPYPVTTVPANAPEHPVKFGNDPLSKAAIWATAAGITVVACWSVSAVSNAWAKDRADKRLQDALDAKVTQANALLWRTLKKHEDDRPGTPYDGAEVSTVKIAAQELADVHAETVKKIEVSNDSGPESALVKILTTGLWVGAGLLAAKFLYDVYSTSKSGSGGGGSTTVVLPEHTASHENKG